MYNKKNNASEEMLDKIFETMNCEIEHEPNEIEKRVNDIWLYSEYDNKDIEINFDELKIYRLNNFEEVIKIGINKKTNENVIINKNHQFFYEKNLELHGQINSLEIPLHSLSIAKSIAYDVFVTFGNIK